MRYSAIEASTLAQIRILLADDHTIIRSGLKLLLEQQPDFKVVAEANDLQNELVFEVTSLPDYLSAAPTDGLESWKGELRSGFRSNMLMGVKSNRVDVKRMGALAERALERAYRLQVRLDVVVVA